jgi:DNA polymerase III alpha subunit
MAFVHLRTHTEFSVVDGTLRIDEAVGAAAADKQVALAVTDLSNLFGAIKFYSAARKAGVKPIIGADVWLEPDGADKAPSRLLLLVQSRQGYLDLCELLSRAWLTNVQRGAQAWLRWEWLAGLGAGLIALSGAEQGAVGQALMGQDPARAREWRSASRRCSRAASTSSCSVRASPATSRTCVRPCRWPPSSGCRWSRHTPCSSSRPRTSRRTRRGSASPRARR